VLLLRHSNLRTKDMAVKLQWSMKIKKNEVVPL
jgi:hypothetical protein